MNPRTTPLRVLPDSWQKGEYVVVVVVSAVCSVSSIFFTLLNGSSLTDNLITIHAVGFSQLALSTLVRLRFRGRLPALGLAFAILAGFVLGSKLASLVGAPDPAALVLQDPVAMRGFIGASLFVGVVVTAFFLYFSYTRGVREELERERRRAAEALQGETAARLALLQAQIEPHFLFNTLANIHALIEQDPTAASRTLEELNAYLRASLRRSRQMTATVGEEIELVEALLALGRARLGARLEHTVSVPPELRSIPCLPVAATARGERDSPRHRARHRRRQDRRRRAPERRWLGADGGRHRCRPECERAGRRRLGERARPTREPLRRER